MEVRENKTVPHHHARAVGAVSPIDEGYGCDHLVDVRSVVVVPPRVPENDHERSEHDEDGPGPEQEPPPVERRAMLTCGDHPDRRPAGLGAEVDPERAPHGSLPAHATAVDVGAPRRVLVADDPSVPRPPEPEVRARDQAIVATTSESRLRPTTTSPRAGKTRSSPPTVIRRLRSSSVMVWKSSSGAAGSSR